VVEDEQQHNQRKQREITAEWFLLTMSNEESRAWNNHEL
jgi:hypothetical protein